jgi:proline iminopeptidase
MRIIISLLCLGLLFACNTSMQKSQNGSPEVIKDSIRMEQLFITLGGEKQYVEISGSLAKNPVLLFLHGGPGWPQTPHLRYFNAALSASMTVVAWEQSGCGKSYMQNPDPKNLSLDQIIKDAHELTQILKKKFHKDKIYLAGFSWGSIPGLKLAAMYPEDYAAYIGITQVLDINNSIQHSRNWILQQAAAKNDTACIRILKKIDQGDTSICKRPMDCFMKQFEFLSKYNGAIFSKESEAQIQISETKYDDYKTYDWYKAFFYSAYRLEKDLFSTNLFNIKELKIPAYFFMGRHDWNLPTDLTVAYFNELKAPKKEMVWFEASGHEPLEEEADHFNKEMTKRIK